MKFVLSPSSITRGYCHGDYSVRNSKVTSDNNNSLTVFIWSIVIDAKYLINTTSSKNHFTEIYWPIFPQAVVNKQDVTGSSGPHSDARPRGVCFPIRQGSGRFCEIVQRWPEWVHNLRVTRAPSIPLAVTQIQGMVTGPEIDPGSGCWGTAGPQSGR